MDSRQGSSTSTAAQATPRWPNTGGVERLTGRVWKPTLALRVAAVLAAGVSVGLLTAAIAGSSLACLTGLAAAATLAWRLRFRPTADTLAWRRGAQGERRTARLLASSGAAAATRSSTTWPSLARPPTSTTWSSAPPGCL